MSIDYRHTTSEDVVGKVLRRAEVAKASPTYMDPVLFPFAIENALLTYNTSDGEEASRPSRIG